MAIKESSDELNPTIAVPASEVAPCERRTAADYLALAIATCGVGYFPIAPGTLGSLVGLSIYLSLRSLTARLYARVVFEHLVTTDLLYTRLSFLFICVLVCVVVFLSLLGIWAASRAERLLGHKDPSLVVIDEVAGQLVTFLFVPYFLPVIPVVAGFLLFRVFDIVKPYPIRRLERLESGLGIMADDIVAGLYAGAILAVISTLGLFAII